MYVISPRPAAELAAALREAHGYGRVLPADERGWRVLEVDGDGAPVAAALPGPWLAVLNAGALEAGYGTLAVRTADGDLIGRVWGTPERPLRFDGARPREVDGLALMAAVGALLPTRVPASRAEHDLDAALRPAVAEEPRGALGAATGPVRVPALIDLLARAVELPVTDAPDGLDSLLVVRAEPAFVRAVARLRGGLRLLPLDERTTLVIAEVREPAARSAAETPIMIEVARRARPGEGVLSLTAHAGGGWEWFLHQETAVASGTWNTAWLEVDDEGRRVSPAAFAAVFGEPTAPTESLFDSPEWPDPVAELARRYRLPAALADYAADTEDARAAAAPVPGADVEPLTTAEKKVLRARADGPSSGAGVAWWAALVLGALALVAALVLGARIGAEWAKPLGGIGALAIVLGGMGVYLRARARNWFVRAG